MAALAATGPGCANVHSYTDPDGPRFDGGYVASLPVSKGEIRAVTYNVEFAANVDDAARELADLEQLAGADIIFLQEMDEHGVDRMARLLECNYLYYPAIRHTMNDKNFGNAVLSRWPLENPEKVILPHADIKRSQKRIAVGATVVIDTLKVRAYSVHTENLWLEPQKRIEQSDSLGERIAEQYSHLIVGGDFNTVTKPTLEATEEVCPARDGPAVRQGVEELQGATEGLGPVQPELWQRFHRDPLPRAV